MPPLVLEAESWLLDGMLLRDSPSSTCDCDHVVWCAVVADVLTEEVAGAELAVVCVAVVWVGRVAAFEGDLGRGRGRPVWAVVVVSRMCCKASRLVLSCSSSLCIASASRSRLRTSDITVANLDRCGIGRNERSKSSKRGHSNLCCCLITRSIIVWTGLDNSEDFIAGDRVT